MKCHVLLLVLLSPLSSLAQSFPDTPWLKKGEIQIGVGFSGGWGSNIGGVVRTTPYAQYFIKDRWAVRLEGQYEALELGKKRPQNSERSQSIGIGLATQYYFLKRNRFALYGQVGYSYGKQRINVYDITSSTAPTETIKGDYNRVGLGVGVQYRLGERWLINGVIEQQINGRFNNSITTGNIGVGFRIK
jgi:outer membrane autotransporter protein